MDRLLVAGWDAGCIIKMSQLAAEAIAIGRAAERQARAFFPTGRWPHRDSF